MQKHETREAWVDGARYPFAEIEAKWQRTWLEEGTFRTTDEPDDRPKYYVLVMFPYPSGSGLHVGHPESYTAADIIARSKRMQGYRVMHPMGWDAFGLPAEQYAVETGIHPRLTTEKNVANFRRQVRSLGLSYDWEREINTTDPAYYRWTQWIFLQLHQSWYDEDAGRARPLAQLPIPEEIRAQGSASVARYQDRWRLAYEDEIAVNWCPALGTVLANEEVIDGRSERGAHPVERLPLRQWVLRITAYADRLLDDLDLLDWPESIKAMQRNWIGKSTGAEIDFPPSTSGLTPRSSFPAEVPPDTLRVYTTRADTLFGVTFMVLSPEHPLVDHFTAPANREAVARYRAEAAVKSDLERTDLALEKSGVATGGFVINPVTGENVPVWIADYVLMTYGTGAIMAVPGHDERDYEFACEFGLEVRPILEKDGEAIAPGEDPPGARYVRSSAEGVSLNGLEVKEGKERIVAWLASMGYGRPATNTKLRDWLFSRQRYWGEPIPVLHRDDGSTLPVADSELPLVLPALEDFRPVGKPEPLLAKVSDWVKVEDPATGEKYLRETNTMPQWAGSCWYYLRYLDPRNDEQLVAPEKERRWMPVDLYIGGAEHAVLHLLYARFWHKFLFDIGCVSTPEPFMRLLNQGMILGEDGAKMSKSLGNVINPDAVVHDYGADALRVYEMFMGPLEVDKPWSTTGIQGASRFLDRIWRAAQLPSPAPGDDPLLRERHRTIRKVTEDIDRIRLNTAIACLMEYVNSLTKAAHASDEDQRVLALLISPFAPHLGEELWARRGNAASLAYERWPAYDPELARAELITLVLQINGKLRARVEVARGLPREELQALALADPTLQRHLAGRTPKKIVVVSDCLVNIVI